MRSSLHISDVHASAESHTLAKLIMSVSFITHSINTVFIYFLCLTRSSCEKHLQLCLALLQAKCKEEETDYWTILPKCVQQNDNKQTVTLTYGEISDNLTWLSYLALLAKWVRRHDSTCETRWLWEADCDWLFQIGTAKQVNVAAKTKRFFAQQRREKWEKDEKQVSCWNGQMWYSQTGYTTVTQIHTVW